ncbi:MgtC/SapB family protein [Dactylosporangium sp. NPDC048998]|uniref:MgtC/SapB family protein n=1 Tax=Dactylosporangium sp. NPDC048998 TaxID=3363976 RepID=UPI0037181F5C
MTHDLVLLGRLFVSFALTFALGYERELRGSTAGDRTFALVGVAGGVIGVLAEHNAPTALAGAITGVGFIGAGLLFRQNPPQATAQDPIASAPKSVGRSQSQLATLHGVTTAATILAAAVIGACAGEGLLLVASGATLLVLLTLELRYLPILKHLDASRFTNHFVSDDEPHAGHRRDPQ